MDETRRRGRPREAALDERILDTTLHLIAEVGYAHTSLDDIATAAHTTRATIYLRYSSKAALVVAAIIHARPPFGVSAPTGNLRQDLVAQLRHFQESMAKPYSLPIVGAALDEEHTTPELLMVFRKEVAASRRQMLRSVLQSAQMSNKLAPSVDIDLAVSQLIGSYYALAIAGESIPSNWPELVADQVLAGIARNIPRIVEG